jgi:hypothetical protein
MNVDVIAFDGFGFDFALLAPRLAPLGGDRVCPRSGSRIFQEHYRLNNLWRKFTQFEK